MPLPHARGGVSLLDGKHSHGNGSSPRPWGCFLFQDNRFQDKTLFPTPVGVFLLCRSKDCAGVALPHARGGVSSYAQFSDDLPPSSPRPWGCFRGVAVELDHKRLFPTPVGVFLGGRGYSATNRTLPHARGGVSHRGDNRRPSGSSSPRPWGCFSFRSPARKRL